MAGSEEPTPRRRERARRAGVVPASAAWAQAGAWAGATIAIVIGGAAAAGAMLAWAASSVAHATDAGAIGRASQVSIVDVIAAVVARAAPIVVAAGVAALIAHAALVRGAWIPRRRVRGAPAIARGAGRRAGDAAIALVRGAAIVAVALHFAIAHASDAAHLGAWASRAPTDTAAADALALLAAALVHVAIAVAITGALDALERARRWRVDLRMTPRERRDEDRELRGDPRWRAARRRVGELPAALTIRDAAIVAVGDRVAVAVRWHPRAHPVPTVVARGRDALASQLLALARRAGVPAIHAPALALELARVPLDTPVPARHHAALAAVLAPRD
ncbi:MAG TPA: EscU/YscU/HrcU family type III secretion system export apparatus switch protein [Kofleriaceae bacterium]|nr:EscU/YscU/HrcU family type III secretion system export apparatus switch protein [Kofleriaceae bacterium]